MRLDDVARSSWGATPVSEAPFSNLDKGIIVHWNGGALGDYTKEAVSQIIQATYNYHVFTNGWIDIAYNFSIDRFGRIWEGRGENKRNAASGDTYANSNYTAVEMLCGKGDAITPEMLQGLREFKRRYVANGGVDKILGHRDVTPTECPGEQIYTFLATIDQAPTTTKEDEDTMVFVESDNGTIYIISAGTKRPLVGAATWADTEWAINNLIASGVARWANPRKVSQGSLNLIPDGVDPITKEALAFATQNRAGGNITAVDLEAAVTRVLSALKITGSLHL